MYINIVQLNSLSFELHLLLGPMFVDIIKNCTNKAQKGRIVVYAQTVDF